MHLPSRVYNAGSAERSHSVTRKPKILLCLGLFALSLFVALPSLGSANAPLRSAASQPSDITLTLISTPPMLPADGGTYSSLFLEFKNTTSGLPYIPSASLNISMSSTNLQAGNVSSSITFPTGSLFVSAPFTTTLSPGETTVNAFVAGYGAASAQIVTTLAGGMPASLELFLSPKQLPPNEKFSGTIIVMAVDSLGNPVELGNSLTVALSSSNSQYGSVPNSVVIPAGNSYGEATFTPTYLAGQTTISASAPGLNSGSASMTTVGPVGTKLVLSAAPPVILASSSESTTLSIQLQDNNSQTPVPAPSAISVVVTSDNTNVANPQSTTVTIPAGSSYATVIVKAGGTQGNATITASAQGYQKGSTLITTITGSTANSLSVSFVPGILLPNNGTYVGAVVIELESCTTSCSPATSASPVTVYTRSSDNATMQVSTLPVTIPAGQSHISTNITTTFRPGNAEITAQAVGLSSNTVSLTSFGLIPNALSVQSGSNELLSDGESYNFVTVGLINQATGSPAIAPVNTVVNLALTSSVVGNVESTVTILSGRSFVRANFTSSGLPGITEITASASNYTTGNANLTLVNPPATNLALFATPNQLLASGQTYENLIVQLQNSFGNPEKTDVPVSIQLSTGSLNVGQVSPQVTIQPGSTFALVSLTATNTPGIVSVTAFSNGFQSGQTEVSTILLPMEAQLQFVSSLRYGALANATVFVESQGAPLLGASVAWQASGGTLSNEVNLTESAGTAVATYRAGSVAGGFKIIAQVSKAGYETLSANSTIAVINPNPTITTQTQPSNSVLGIPFLGMPIAGVPLWAIIMIAAGGAGGGFFYMKRIRGGGFEYQDEE